MNTRERGYKVKEYHQPVKRYCQTLDLKNDSALIAEYVKRHADIWPEIKTGICEVGILEMQIFLLGTRLFMIVETPLDFDWDSAMSSGLISIVCSSPSLVRPSAKHKAL